MGVTFLNIRAHIAILTLIKLYKPSVVNQFMVVIAAIMVIIDKNHQNENFHVF